MNEQETAAWCQGRDAAVLHLHETSEELKRQRATSPVGTHDRVTLDSAIQLLRHMAERILNLQPPK